MQWKRAGERQRASGFLKANFNVFFLVLLCRIGMNNFLNDLFNKTINFLKPKQVEGFKTVMKAVHEDTQDMIFQYQPRLVVF